MNRLSLKIIGLAALVMAVIISVYIFWPAKPPEAFCKTLTSRLKGSGMRWDKPNAEGLMALASVRCSGLWRQYWNAQKKLSA